MIGRSAPIAVVGAGTMGAGIGLVAKGRLDVDPSALRLAVAHGLDDLGPAQCVIEAVVEVEVVSGLATDPGVAAAVTKLAEDWGKQVVQAAATPGFIVNRVARPFYAEALRLAEEQAATSATIDAALTQAGGFRMGPFALMEQLGL